ncbi:CDP-glycerol glycerophosphotransferase family protein [Bordetella sp. N]|uniref:CDP-glycerol glycerophosphotransferase family protein n=1 Tax=Bordetella sp. N TaxID=1746199 RepID=UPI00070E564C|nr:CDP-glycerol glycerophosphotransferase family protein [Bordetella sp. N]ALM85275.1 hypothetical protein ASB57_21935 [Bordetella sp. N]
MVKKLLRHLRETLTITREVRQLSNVHLDALSATQHAIQSQTDALARQTDALAVSLKQNVASFSERFDQELDFRPAVNDLRDRQKDTSETLERLESELQRVTAEASEIATTLKQVLARQVRDSAQQASAKIRPIRVRFFFQAPETWTTWESVWRACNAHPRIDPLMVLLPFNHDSALGEDKARNFLADQSIPFVNISAYQLDLDAPDIVFLQNPYDSTRPADFGVERIIASGARIAYIPYGLDVGGGSDNLRWQYDLDVQRYAWRVFARSEAHRRMYGRICQSGNRHVIVTGHPKIDYIVRCGQSARVPEEQPENRAKVILWTPHFTVEPGGWSTFSLYANALLSYFEAGPQNLRLLIRPHPLFFGRLRQQDAATTMSESEFRTRIAESPFIELDEEPQYFATFAKSDALMTDAGSFLLEYLPTGKPILYLHNPAGPGLNETADFVNSYAQAHTFDDITAFLAAVLDGTDLGSERRLTQIERVLHRVDGQVGETIVAHIVDGFERDGSYGAGLPYTGEQ